MFAKDSENTGASSSPLKTAKDENCHKDFYCFECHQDDDDVINCVSCPRAYHSTCLRLTIIPERDWTCPECEVTQPSFDIINQSVPLQNPARNELQITLKHALRRLKAHPQAEHFMQTSEYPDYIIHPMDLKTIESNLQRKKYSSTDAFMGDMKWMLHNCIIHNGNQSKLTHTARAFLRIARQEMAQIETCSECYLHSAQAISADWFTKPCTVPHTLCWAKLRTYQAWPAKVLRVTNDEVDVRFFGEHDRAWVSINDCFILSKEYPGVQKKKTNLSLKRSLDELESHIDQLKKLYGHFTYAPPYKAISKTKAFKFISIIDDSILPYYMAVDNKLHSFKKNSKQKCSNEAVHDYEQATKRMRMSTDENQLQSNLNVFDILKYAESSSIRPTDNKLRIQALLRKYTDRHSSAIDTVRLDVRLSMNALLDAVETLQSVSDVPTNPIISTANNQISEQRLRTKKPRKSNSQHHVLQTNTRSNFTTCASLPFVPLSIDTFESLPCITNEMIPTEILSVKSDLTDNEQNQHTQSSETNISLPTIIPNSHSYPPISQTKNKTSRRKRPPRHSATSSDSISMNPQYSEQLRDHLQTTINSFNDRFQELLVNFTGQIEQSLEATRMKYEQDLEETRRSYRTSLNDLHSTTTEQIHEIHNDLEVQYLQRLSEMRRRYESKLQYH